MRTLGPVVYARDQGPGEQMSWTDIDLWEASR